MALELLLPLGLREPEGEPEELGLLEREELAVGEVELLALLLARPEAESAPLALAEPQAGEEAEGSMREEGGLTSNWHWSLVSLARISITTASGTQLSSAPSTTCACACCCSADSDSTNAGSISFLQ